MTGFLDSVVVRKGRYSLSWSSSSSGVSVSMHCIVVGETILQVRCLTWSLAAEALLITLFEGTLSTRRLKLKI
jgi:hypothetical protein